MFDKNKKLRSLRRTKKLEDANFLIQDNYSQWQETALKKRYPSRQ